MKSVCISTLADIKIRFLLDKRGTVASQSIKQTMRCTRTSTCTSETIQCERQMNASKQSNLISWSKTTNYYSLEALVIHKRKNPEQFTNRTRGQQK